MSESPPESTPPSSNESPASRRTNWVLRRIPLMVFLVIVACGLFAFYWQQPTDLENEIRLDLLAKQTIEDSARVRVLDKTTLVTFHHQGFRQLFATICIQDGSQLHLAQAECPRPGATWRTNKADWTALNSWPSIEQRKQYQQLQASQLLPALTAGYLPRPGDKADFQVGHLSIAASERTDGFDPNDGIDHALLAHLLKYEVQYTARPHLNRFTFAPFHEPRWFDPADAIAELHEYAEFLQHNCDRTELSPARCNTLISALQITVRQLTRLSDRGLKFHFRAGAVTRD